jgi:hypothetical protein
VSIDGACALSEFQRGTSVRELAPGRYVADVDPGWGTPIGPNGGYVAALVVRALEAGVNPLGERRLRSLTCHYLRTPALGELELDVELVRSGRRFATGQLGARQGGKQVLLALASFAIPDLEVEASWTPLVPEVAPAPARDAGESNPEDGLRHDDLWLPRNRGPGTLAERMLLSPRFGAGRPFAAAPVTPGRGIETGGWLVLGDPQPVDSACVALYADAWWPPAFEALTKPAAMPTIDLTIHIRADIPPEGLPDQPILGRYRSNAATGGLVEEDGELFLADGTLLAQSRQLALLSPFPG